MEQAINTVKIASRRRWPFQRLTWSVARIFLWTIVGLTLTDYLPLWLALSVGGIGLLWHVRSLVDFTRPPTPQPCFICMDPVTFPLPMQLTREEMHDLVTHSIPPCLDARPLHWVCQQDVKTWLRLQIAIHDQNPDDPGDPRDRASV